jgi:hypothetical protein
MVGLDPAIHKPLKRLDPRVRPEDDGVLGAMFATKQKGRGQFRDLLHI